MERAADFIMDMVEDGPVSNPQIKRLAKAFGISDVAIRRAKQSLRAAKKIEIARSGSRTNPYIVSMVR